MDNTFIKIGDVIKKDPSLKSKYNPNIVVRNLIDNKGKNIKNIYPYRIHVNMDDQTVNISEVDGGLPNKINCVLFRVGNSRANPKYLGGNFILKTKSDKRGKISFDNDLSFISFENNFLKSKIYSNIFNNESFILKYITLFYDNISKIKEYTSNALTDDKISEIALLVNVTYNGKTDEILGFEEYINEVEKMFIQMSYVKDKGYCFTHSFYLSFMKDKFSNINSIPYYNKEDFLSLYYAKSIYMLNGKSLFGNYAVTIYPNFDDMAIDDIETLMFKGKNLFDFNNICEIIENSGEYRSKHDKRLLKNLIKFEVHYKYCHGNAGYKTFLKINSVRYSRLLNIRDNINFAYETVYGKNSKKTKDIYWDLNNFYKIENDSTDRYHKIKLKILQNIYLEKYNVPLIALNILLDKIQHEIRIDRKPRDVWTELFNYYKTFKLMENKNYQKDLENSNSYIMGVELGKYEAIYRDDRKNLTKFAQRFAGNITRNVKTIEDVRKYYIQLTQRLIINDAKINEHNILLELLNMNSINFNKYDFIQGFFNEKYSFKQKKEETPIIVDNQ